MRRFALTLALSAALFAIGALVTDRDGFGVFGAPFTVECCTRV
jgi:hypothetical protein